MFEKSQDRLISILIDTKSNQKKLETKVAQLILRFSDTIAFSIEFCKEHQESIIYLLDTINLVICRFCILAISG